MPRTLTRETITLRALGRDLARQDAALDASDPIRVPRTARGIEGWLEGNADPELTRICASARRRTTVEAAYRRAVR